MGAVKITYSVLIKRVYVTRQKQVSSERTKVRVVSTSLQHVRFSGEYSSTVFDYRSVVSGFEVRIQTYTAAPNIYIYIF